MSLCEFQYRDQGKQPHCYTPTIQEKLAKIWGYGIPNNLRDEIIEELGRRCKWCESTMDLEIDHIIPQVINMNHLIDNLQILCKSCHAGKTVFDRSNR